MLVVWRAFSLSSDTRSFGNAMLMLASSRWLVLVASLLTSDTKNRWNARPHSGQAPLMHRRRRLQRARILASFAASENWDANRRNRLMHRLRAFFASSAVGAAGPVGRLVSTPNTVRLPTRSAIKGGTRV